MDFETLLQSLINPGEDGPSPTIYDDLSASYTDATSTRDAKISESEGALAEALAELNRVKAMNYDLMIAAVAEPANSGDDENETNSDEDSDDIGDDDDFFEDEDK